MMLGFRQATAAAQRDVDMSEIGQAIVQALSVNNRWLLATWIIVASAAVACLLVQITGPRPSPATGPSLSLYASIVLVIAIGTGALFVITSRMAPYLWHFGPLSPWRA